MIVLKKIGMDSMVRAFLTTPAQNKISCFLDSFEEVEMLEKETQDLNLQN